MQPTAVHNARFVIPPGQEAVITRMLRPRVELEAGWRFDRAVIRSDAIQGFYDGPDGAKARVILKAPENAPPEWPRTRRFAVGFAADPAQPSAVLLCRTVLAAVLAAEAAFTWRKIDAAPAPRPDPDGAARARAAEGEIDLHLDHTPFIDLGIEFDHCGALAEAMALADRFVAYQSDPRYGVTGWRGLALQALDGDPTHVATTDEDSGVYQDQSRYRLTDVAALCPVTMAMARRVLDLDNCRTVAFLMVVPGGRITVHDDGVGPPVVRSLNVALNMPQRCRFVIDCNPDGSDNPYTRIVPFRDGSTLLVNVAKYHYVVNDSDEPRIHLVARGSLRIPAMRVLALAEAQDGLGGIAAVEEALAAKRKVLGVREPAVESPPSERSDRTSRPSVLSSYVSALADAARDRLLSLTDLCDRAVSARIGPAADGSDEWRLEVAVRLPSGRTTHFDFRHARPGSPAWFRTAHLACSYRTGGGDPFADARDATFLNAFCGRLGRLDPQPPAAVAPPVVAFLDAVDRYRPFLHVKDEDYRIIFHGAEEPVGILWLGFQCNQDCRMCWQGRRWPAPPDEVFDRWIDELCEAGVRSLVLSGGEPTLQPRLSRWLQRATRAGAHVTLETNATRFTEPGVLHELREAGLESVVVSLHAADGAVSDTLTGTPGTFPLTIGGIHAALAAGVRVGVHCVIERDNVAGLEAHARFVADELRAGDNRITHVSYSFPIRYHRREIYRDAIPGLDVVRPRLSAAVRVLRAEGIEVRFLGTGGFTPCAIDDPTSLAPLLPRVVTDDMRSGRLFLEPCTACSLRDRCLGIHEAYAEVHGTRGVEPVARLT